MLEIPFVGKKSQVLFEPLFSELDQRRLVPLIEVCKKLGWSEGRLRSYALDGTIPGGRQAGKGKPWTFDRDLLEEWWQKFCSGELNNK